MPEGTGKYQAPNSQELTARQGAVVANQCSSEHLVCRETSSPGKHWLGETEPGRTLTKARVISNSPLPPCTATEVSTEKVAEQTGPGPWGGDTWRCPGTFLVVTTLGTRVLLVSNGLRSEMLLNILQCNQEFASPKSPQVSRLGDPVLGHGTATTQAEPGTTGSRASGSYLRLEGCAPG